MQTHAEPTVALPGASTEEESEGSQGSPSLRVNAATFNSLSLDFSALASVFPKIQFAPTPALVGVMEDVQPGDRIVVINELNVSFRRALCKRASRAAKANAPSSAAYADARSSIERAEHWLRKLGYSRVAVQRDPLLKAISMTRGGPVSACLPMDDDGAEACAHLRKKSQHLNTVRSSNVDSHNQEPSWLLCGGTAPQMIDRLLESALRANAVNAAVMKRSEKQGASYQTTRINCKTVGQAAAAQCVAVAITIALAECELRERGTRVVDPTATNAFDPCELASQTALARAHDASHKARRETLSIDEVRRRFLVPIVGSEWLVFNANPVKLGFGCIRRDMQKLAGMELSHEVVSSRCGAPQHMIRHVCAAIQSEGYVTDPLWASIVLIVYLCCESRARCLLTEHTSLTDMDVHIAFVLEAYGRGEITRRARLRMQQEQQEQQAQQQQQREQRRGADKKDRCRTHERCNPYSAHDKKRRRCDPIAGLEVEDDTSSVVNGDEGDDHHDAAIARFCAEEIGSLLPDSVQSVDSERASSLYGDDDEDAASKRRQEQDDGDENAEFYDHANESSSLASKRRRACKSGNTGLAFDSYTVISWWYRALRCEEAFSVVGQLCAGSTDRALDASERALQQQVSDSGACHSALLQAKAAQNATRSQEQLERFVTRCAYQAPRWVVLRIPTGARGRDAVRGVGVMRIPAHDVNEKGVVTDSPTDACSRPPVVLHSFLFASHQLQPAVHTRMAILWSQAAEHLRESTANLVAANILEARAALFQDNTGHCKPKKLPPAIQACHWTIEYNTTEPVLSSDSGLTRSVVVAASLMAVHTSTLSCARLFANEGVAVLDNGAPAAVQPAPCFLAAVEAVGAVPMATERREPLCTPAGRLAVGLRISEFVRRCMRGRTRKNDPCKVLLGVHSNAEVSRESAPIMDSEPLPLASITDFKLRCPSTASCEALSSTEQHLRVDMSLCLCLDGATRAVDAMRLLQDTALSAIPMARGLLYAGSSQASFVGDLGASLSASNANSAISASKRIAVADVNTLCLLSIWDVYAGGLSNVRPSFSGTAYCGAYGPPLHTGITSVGLEGHNVRSDNRGHSTLHVSQHVADEYCKHLAQCYYVVDPTQGTFAVAPVATRGIPHGYVPGVHKLLDETENALEFAASAAKECGHETGDVLQGLFCLPFSAFTQALAPDVECTADPTLRQCFRNPDDASVRTGRSYLPDTTSEHEAIVIEPLFRRPCQCNSGDNPFATSYEHVDSLFNALNTIAVIAMQIEAGSAGVDALHALISDWHAPRRDVAAAAPPLRQQRYQWAADCCVLLFGCIFPSSHAIAETVVPQCYAQACARHAKRALGTVERTGARIDDLFCDAEDEPLRTEARELWSRYCRDDRSKCPWHAAVAPMLRIIVEKAGSHTTTKAEFDTFRHALNRVVTHGSWLTYSRDGVAPPEAPNPAHRCVTPNDVRAPTIDPIFASIGNDLQYSARGCLVGLKPFQLRQLYALMLGAHLRGVDNVQVVRNEGGLLLRESSMPTILTQDGGRRSAKGIAPTQTEGDHGGFGTRKSKCYGAELQKRAWDANALLQLPLVCALNPPQPASKRWRGARDDDRDVMNIKRARELSTVQACEVATPNEFKHDATRAAAFDMDVASASVFAQLIGARDGGGVD